MAVMHRSWVRATPREPAKRGPKPHAAEPAPPEGAAGFGAAWTALTRTQRTVARRRCQGMSNAETGYALGVSSQTIKNAMTAIFKALRITSGDLLCYQLGRYDAGPKIVVAGTTREAA